MKEQKRYSIWDNFRYTFYLLKQKEGNGALAFCGGNMAMSILLPFLEAALAGTVAACLSSQRKPEIILLLITGYVILLQAARFLYHHLQKVQQKTLFIFRGGMMDDFYKKILEMDGQSLESATGQQKKDAATRNLFTGNDFGVEAYAQSGLTLCANLGGLALYSIIVGRCSLLLLLLLTAQTMFSSFLHFLAG